MIGNKITNCNWSKENNFSSKRVFGKHFSSMGNFKQNLTLKRRPEKQMNIIMVRIVWWVVLIIWSIRRVMAKCQADVKLRKKFGHLIVAVVAGMSMWYCDRQMIMGLWHFRCHIFFLILFMMFWGAIIETSIRLMACFICANSLTLQPPDSHTRTIQNVL